jgi:hypothetical protein
MPPAEHDVFLDTLCDDGGRNELALRRRDRRLARSRT